MVNADSNLAEPQPEMPEYILEAQALLAKTGHDEDGEDALYLGLHYVVVIDGVTSKTARRWEGKTGGRIAASIIGAAFDHIPYNANARQAVDMITTAIKDFYVEHTVLDVMATDPVQRIVACFAAINFWRKEVWFVGDCQCLFDQEQVPTTKMIDTITANARSLFLEAEITKGKTIEELRQQDTGRAFILPLLERQMLFQNNPAAGQYWFPVIDGFPVPDEGIRIEPFPSEVDTIVLASDGYPYVKDSLEASEQALQDVLRDDPLLFRMYKATKGLQMGNVSFDDRAYVKVRLKKEAESRPGE